MSKYTTEIRYICEHLCGLDDSKGYNDINTIIANARTKLFNFNYPIFDENYRPVLETKVLKHFYTREIGEETVGLWKLRLDSKLNEIMPYFNKLYESELIKFDPLHTTDLQTQRISNNEVDKNTGENLNDRNLSTSNSHSDINEVNRVENQGTSKTENRGLRDEGATHDGVNRDMYSDTPQGSLNGVEDGTYLTNARKVTDSHADNGHTHALDVGNISANNSTNSVGANSADAKSDATNIRGMERTTNENLNSTEKYIDHIVGYNGYVPSELIKKYRDILINIDLMIIGELEPLFMQLW